MLNWVRQTAGCVSVTRTDEYSAHRDCPGEVNAVTRPLQLFVLFCLIIFQPSSMYSASKMGVLLLLVWCRLLESNSDVRCITATYCIGEQIHVSASSYSLFIQLVRIYDIPRGISDGPKCPNHLCNQVFPLLMAHMGFPSHWFASPTLFLPHLVSWSQFRCHPWLIVDYKLLLTKLVHIHRY